MNKLNGAVATWIIRAQVANLGGKGFGFDNAKRIIPSGPFYNHKGYDSKEHCILKAIRTINRTKNSGFYYYVTVGEDQNGIPCYLVNFNFKIDGERHQIAFHCFSKRFHIYCNEICSTRYDHKLSATKTAILLVDLFFR